jgi:hypothetical protein
MRDAAMLQWQNSKLENIISYHYITFYLRELAKIRGYTSCFVVAVAVVARPLLIEAV